MRTALMSEMIFAVAENAERRARSAENSNLVNNDSKKKHPSAEHPGKCSLGGTAQKCYSSDTQN